MATSNETKMKGKIRVAEKVATPLFNLVKAEAPEQKPEIVEVTSEEKFPQMANPLPVTEKPRRGRRPKAKPLPEPVSSIEETPVPEPTPAPAPEKKRRGRPKKNPVVTEELPVEEVVEELMPEKKRSQRKEDGLFTE